jgi:ribose 5-phosphate isomerase A
VSFRATYVRPASPLPSAPRFSVKNSAPDLAVLAEKALEWVCDGMIVGLGSGRASTAFIEALGRRVAQGLQIRGVPTSEASATVARRGGIPLVTLDEVDAIDLTIDGADEVDPRGDCIKGYGGALVREKIVAAYSKRLVILIGQEKEVQQLGERGKLPVEVLPFALPLCRRRIAALHLTSELRLMAGKPLVSDNGNYVLDVTVGPLSDPAGTEQALRAIPGLLGTGLFLGMANTILVERHGSVEKRTIR